MAWRSSLWARWLGWTALYVLVLLGGGLLTRWFVSFFFPSDSNYPEWLSTLFVVLTLLVPAVLAVGIGIRFRSRWWGLGPLVAFGLLAAALVIAFWNGAISDVLFIMVFPISLVIYGGILIPFALQGAWWGNRRHAANTPEPPSSTTLPPRYR
jgi:hypothetical protein